MAVAEKHFADILIELRAEQATGTGYVPIGDTIAIAQRALDELQTARAVIGRMANHVEAITVTDRPVRSGT